MRRILAAALFALLVVPAAQVHATILTFDIVDPANFKEISTYGTRVNSLSDADGSYLMGNGFTPNITSNFRTLSTDPLGDENYVGFWFNDYGDLVNVAYAAFNGGLFELTLTPDAGYGVRLNSFDIGGYLRTTREDQPLYITDANGNLLLDLGPIDAPGSGHTTVTPALSHVGAIKLYYSSTWNAGIDNINFDQFVPGTAVPEPSTIASAGLALVASLAIARRRRSA
ncbi:MAG: PEP-CTERM sorting domain-containing protein [Isosphaeraceae bacterium]|nr:PEP-CTERM sorting domain-containing protein [Isosphaeraceae bacterium]